MAILLNNDYYGWIQTGKTNINGIEVVSAEYLIPLKARAWVDLTERKAAGQHIDSRTINKHKKDIFRLYQIIDPEMIIETPQSIKNDIAEFLAAVTEDDYSLDGVTHTELSTGLRSLYSIYS